MKKKSRLLFLLLFGFFGIISCVLPQSLIGVWEKSFGPGDPVKYDFINDNIVHVHFQTRIDSADYTTITLASPTIRELSLSGNGVVGWRGIYQISTDNNTLTIEGFWYSGLPVVEAPLLFTNPTTYSRIATAIGTAEIEIPNMFRLHQNYPNPFNPSTIISYEIPTTSVVELKIYDTIGKEITAIVNQEQSPGIYNVGFNASSAGGGLSSGVYIYKLKAGNFQKTAKMVLLR